MTSDELPRALLHVGLGEQVKDVGAEEERGDELRSEKRPHATAVKMGKFEYRPALVQGKEACRYSRAGRSS